MKNNLEQFFSETNFDIYEPQIGHKNRFLEKLQTSQKTKKSFSWLGIVASVALLISFLGGMFYQNMQYDLKDVSSEMAETQNFFMATINNDLKKIKSYRNPKTDKIIDDAIIRLNDLEKAYNILQKDLKTTDNQKIIILNMIQNYQQRLEILENVLEVLKQQENTFNLKFNKNEIS